MLREYAIDPKAVTHWRDRSTQRLILEAFRFGNGRVPACLPAKWTKQALGVWDGADDSEKKRLEVFVEALWKLKSKRQATDAWNGQARSWIENVLLEHQRRPFHAIVSPGAVVQCLDVVNTDVDLGEGKWRVARTIRVPRSGAALAEAVGPILYASPNIIIVDPVFKPEKRFADALGCLLAASAKPKQSTTIQVLMRETPKDPPWCNIEREFNGLSKKVPAGVSLELVYVEQAKVSSRLHNRFILSDVGGIMLGDSIDEGDEGEYNDLALMDEQHFNDVLSDARQALQLEKAQRKLIGGLRR